MIERGTSRSIHLVSGQGGARATKYDGARKKLGSIYRNRVVCVCLGIIERETRNIESGPDTHSLMSQDAAIKN